MRMPAGVLQRAVELRSVALEQFLRFRGGLLRILDVLLLSRQQIL